MHLPLHAHDLTQEPWQRLPLSLDQQCLLESHQSTFSVCCECHAQSSVVILSMNVHAPQALLQHMRGTQLVGEVELVWGIQAARLGDWIAFRHASSSQHLKWTWVSIGTAVCAFVIVLSHMCVIQLAQPRECRLSCTHPPTSTAPKPRALSPPLRKQPPYLQRIQRHDELCHLPVINVEDAKWPQGSAVSCSDPLSQVYPIPSTHQTMTARVLSTPGQSPRHSSAPLSWRRAHHLHFAWSRQSDSLVGSKRAPSHEYHTTVLTDACHPLRTTLINSHRTVPSFKAFGSWSGNSQSEIACPMTRSMFCPSIT
jgi:hypothetical protein